MGDGRIHGTNAAMARAGIMLPPADDFVLTPEMVLAMAASEMGGTQERISLLMTKQKDVNARKTLISKVKEMLLNAKTYKGLENIDENKSKDKVSALMKDVENDLRNVYGDATTADAIKEMKGTVDGVGDKGKVDENALESMIQRLDTLSDNITNDTQINMLRLQDAVKQLEQINTFASNTLAALHQQRMVALNNIK